MILLQKLKLENFLSHEETEITFNDSERLSIEGASGSGKSSILDAIIFALYGEGRSDNRSLIRRGAKRASVKLHLKDDSGKIIIIEREITHTGKHTLEVLHLTGGTSVASPLTGVKALQEYIEKEIVGASYLLFINSVAYVQGGNDSFVMQNAVRRKELLLELVKAGDFEDLYERAKEKAHEISKKKEELEGKLSSLILSIGTYETSLSLEKEKEERQFTLKEEIRVLREKKDGLQKLISSFESQTALVHVHIAEFKRARLAEAELKEKIEKKEQFIALMKTDDGKKEELEAERSTLEAELVTLDNLFRSETEKKDLILKHKDKKPRSTVDYEKSIEELDQQIKSFNEKPQCPSGAECPYQGNHLVLISSLEKRKGALLLDSIRFDNDLRNWENEAAALPQEAADTGALKKRVVEVAKEVQERERQIRDLNDKESLYRASLENVPTLKEELEKAVLRTTEAQKRKEEAELSVSGFDRSSTETSLRDCEERLEHKVIALNDVDAYLAGVPLTKEYLAAAKEEKALVALALAETDRQTEALTLVKEAFSNRGVKTVVIDYLLPRLEEKINTILSQMSDFRVKLDTQQLKADGEGNKEGLFITIFSPSGDEMPFESYSGGEKVKITVAITEALATLQKVGWRVFDETFMSLDANSTESFMQVMEKLQEKYPQVLVVSHLQEIKDLFEKKIVITKKDNISYVK